MRKGVPLRMSRSFFSPRRRHHVTMSPSGCVRRWGARGRAFAMIVCAVHYYASSSSALLVIMNDFSDNDHCLSLILVVVVLYRRCRQQEAARQRQAGNSAVHGEAAGEPLVS